MPILNWWQKHQKICSICCVVRKLLVESTSAFIKLRIRFVCCKMTIWWIQIMQFLIGSHRKTWPFVCNCYSKNVCIFLVENTKKGLHQFSHLFFFFALVSELRTTFQSNAKTWKQSHNHRYAQQILHLTNRSEIWQWKKLKKCI